MTKRNVVGRGIEALISGADTSVQPRTAALNSICEIDISKIEVNPFQPRQDFAEEDLKELSQSISKLGIIQPITVRLTAGGKYQIISGERRFRASKMAGLSTIPAYVKSAEEQDMMEMALVENLQRSDLNAMEIALSFQSLIDNFSLTQDTLSQRVGKSRATVTNYLRLMKLPAQIQLGIRDNKISMGHARALLSFEDPELQLDTYRQILEKDLSVRKVEELARLATLPEKPAARNSVPNQSVINAGKKIESILKSKVTVRMKGTSKGQLIIPFVSQNDLERIVGLITRK